MTDADPKKPTEDKAEAGDPAPAPAADAAAAATLEGDDLFDEFGEELVFSSHRSFPFSFSFSLSLSPLAFIDLFFLEESQMTLKALSRLCHRRKKKSKEGSRVER